MTITDLASRLAAKTLESGIRQCEMGLGDCGLADLRNALHIEQETVIPRNNIHTAKIHFWMGRAYTKQSQFQDGINSFHMALHIQEALVGRNHEDTMTTYHYLGLLHLKRPQYYQHQLLLQHREHQRQQRENHRFTFTANPNMHNAAGNASHNYDGIIPQLQLSQSLSPTSQGSMQGSPHSFNAAAQAAAAAAIATNHQSNKEDPFHALIFLRTCTRVQMWKYGTYNACAEPNSRQLLYQLLDPLAMQNINNNNGGSGLRKHDNNNGNDNDNHNNTIERVQTDLLEHHRAMAESIQLEKSADTYRQQGQYKLAIQEYEKACKLEEFAFGSTNPTLCWLWRKLAVLNCIKSFTDDTAIDWSIADLVSRNWMEAQIMHPKNIQLSSEATEVVFRGDDHYQQNRYEASIRCYTKAISIGRSRRKSSKKSSSSGHHSSSKSRSR